MAATQASTTIHQALNNAPPPPYTDDVDSDTDSQPEDTDQPHKVTINAGHTVSGHNNLVPCSIYPATIDNATKMSAALLIAVARLNDDNAANGASRRIRLDLTINCGVTVSGSRNVTGAFGLARKTQVGKTDGVAAAAGETESAKPEVVVGAKRKADDDEVS